MRLFVYASTFDLFNDGMAVCGIICHTMDQTSFDLGWAVGFFEGEGCFSVSVQKRNNNNIDYSFPVATLANTDLFRLRRFYNIVSVGRISDKYQRKTGKPYWVWRAHTFTEVHHVANLLYPYLSPRRRQQARKVLACKPKGIGRLEVGKTCMHGHAIHTIDDLEFYRNTVMCYQCRRESDRRRYHASRS